MKLRTKLMLGTQILLLAALALFGVLAVRTCRQSMLSDAVAYTRTAQAEAADEIRRTLGKLSSDASELTVRSALHYTARALESSGLCYAVQSGDAVIYNNTGIDVYRLLSARGTLSDISGAELAAVVSRPEGDFCVVGGLVCLYRDADSGDAYLLAAVRDITSSMDRVRSVTQSCVLIGLAILVLTALLDAVILLSALRPLRTLEESARHLAQGEYGSRIRLERRDELGRLAQHFNEMAQAVETHVDTLQIQAEERQMLLAALAHEMRTPVTAITGYSYALRYGKLSEDQRQEAVATVDDQSRRLARLSDKLAQLIQLDGEMELEQVSPPQLLALARRTLAPMAEEHGIELIFDAQEGEIRGDFDLLLSLILNLADNARKAGARRVEITLLDNVLTVTDDGGGIPREEVAKIRQPFYKVDRSRNREGFGLGLALCQRIAVIHGSDLEIESEVGRGSSFRLKLNA